LTAWLAKAVINGNIRSDCANTIAFIENNQPKWPKGPDLDNIKYTKSPKTTEGIANIAFNTSSTKGFNLKLEQAINAPKIIANGAATNIDNPLTDKERSTIDQSAESGVKIRW
jgi:hypothetical protein